MEALVRSGSASRCNPIRSGIPLRLASANGAIRHALCLTAGLRMGNSLASACGNMSFEIVLNSPAPALRLRYFPFAPARIREEKDHMAPLSMSLSIPTYVILHPEYAHLRPAVEQCFSGDSSVQIIIDRRAGDRRTDECGVKEDRRVCDRRRSVMPFIDVLMPPEENADLG